MIGLIQSVFQAECYSINFATIVELVNFGIMDWVAKFAKLCESQHGHAPSQLNYGAVNVFGIV